MFESKKRTKHTALSALRLGGILTAATLTAALLAQTAQAAGVTLYEWNEGGPGNGVLNVDLDSQHSAIGPVLADDFVTASSGTVHSVTWWGSAALASDQWEITFHGNSNINDPAFPFISQHFVSGITGTDADGDGVFEFTANWVPQDTILTAGTQYWFSVANATSGWLWALAGAIGPQVGSENFFAMESVGGLPSVVPGPHDGPWALPLDASGALIRQDLAFRISAVPIPAAAWLFASALGVLGYLGKRKAKA